MLPVQVSVSATSRSCSIVSWAPMAARRTSRRTSCSPPNGGAWPWPSASTISDDEGQLGADGVGVGARFQAAGQLLAERTGGVAGQQLADLVEFQQFQRV